MMTTNIEVLRKRGYIEDVDVEVYKGKEKEELIKLLDSKEPCVRSSAVRALSLFYNMNEVEISNIILKKLSKEKCLYTRIELGAALEKGGVVTAQQMINYIGKIGNNQHKKLPERPSKKISFPLARDFIVRSLGRMDTKIMPVMINVLDSRNEEIIAEILDAIGYMAFYNNSTAKPEYADKIIETINKYKYNNVIYWKGILCLSGFPLCKTVQFLKMVIETESIPLLVDEAKRSLRLLKNTS